MKKNFYCFFFLILSISIFGQSAQSMDEILKSEYLTNGQACYLLGCFDDTVVATDSFDLAFSKYSELKLFKGRKASDNVRLDAFSYLVAKNLPSKSLWWKVSNSPHYALRYLKKEGLINSKKVASSNLTPEYALNILSKASENFVVHSNETTKSSEKSTTKKGAKNE